MTIKTGNEELDKLLENEEVFNALQTYIEGETSGLRSNKDRAVTDLHNLKKTFDDYGGVDAAKEILANHEKDLAEARRKALEEARNSGDVKAVEDTYKKQVEAAQKHAASLEQMLVNEKIETEVTKAVTDAGGSMKILGKLIRDRVNGSVVDGKIVLEVLDDNGEPYILENSNRATVADVVKDFKEDEDFGGAFKVETSSGSNLRQGNGGATNNGNNPFKADEKGNRDWNIIHETAQNNPEQYKVWAEEAGLVTLPE